ncbi:hypothetical protein JCM10212_002016 [Sporobolomyces blumeae]
MLRTLLHKACPRPLPLATLRPFSTTPASLAKKPKPKINRELFPRPARRAQPKAAPEPWDTLDSYKLTAQLLRLTSESNFPLALKLLQTARRDAATTVVWNVLLNAVFQHNAGRTKSEDAVVQASSTIKHAYEIWTDMKKRGVRPTVRSFGTFLGGVAKLGKKLESRVKSSGSTKDMLGAGVRGQVEIVHKQWMMHCRSVATQSIPAAVEDSGLGGLSFEPESTAKASAETLDDLSPHPTNQYLAFLASCLNFASRHDLKTANTLLTQLLETFDLLPPPSPASDEPMARNAATYAIVLNGLRSAVKFSDSLETPSASFPTTASLLETATSLFTPLLSPSTRLPDADPLNPQLATSFLSLFLVPAASSISYPVQTRIIDLLSQIHGLVPPDQLASLEPPVSPSVPTACSTPPLDPGALEVVLKLLSKWEKSEWSEGVYEQVTAHPERFFGSGATDNVRIEHAEVVLEGMAKRGDAESARALLTRLESEPSSSSLFPRTETYDLVLETAWRSGKVDLAWHVFDLFASPTSGSGSTSTSRLVEPSYRSATYLLLAALSTRDRTQIWRAIKFLAVEPDLEPARSVERSFRRKFGPRGFPVPDLDKTRKDREAGLTRRERMEKRMGEQRETKWMVRYGQAVSTCLARILKRSRDGDKAGTEGSASGSMRDVIGEPNVSVLDRWQEQVKEWVDGRVKLIEGKKAVGQKSEGDDLELESMEDRRKAVEAKEALRAKLRDEHGQENGGPDAAERKVGRKERRMGWWKEREEHVEMLDREARELGRDRIRRNSALREERPRGGGAFSQAKAYAEKGRTHVNAGLKKVDDQWASQRGGAGAGTHPNDGASSPGLASGPPPPPPMRTGSASGPPPPPASRTRAASNASTSAGLPTSSARPGGVFSFVNLDPREKEAFFALLDEYFSSRPQFASLFASSSPTSAAAPISSPPPAFSASPAPPPRAPAPPQQRGIGTAVALYDFEGAAEEDLAFKEGDRITVTEIVSDDWWRGELGGRQGIFPASYAQMS